jgi:hypothetical protein
MPILSRLRTTAAALVSGLFLATSSIAADQPAPMRIDAQMLDGGRYSLEDTRGSITLLSFWSPDSLASRKCLGELQRFHAEYESRGVKVVAVSTVNDAAMLRAFVAKRKLNVPVAMLGEHNLGPLPEHRLPIVLVFDRDGQLVASRAGLYSYRMLEVLAVPPLMKPVSGAAAQPG